MGHGADGADREIHALLSHLVYDRPAVEVDRHQRELAVDARLLESGVSRGARDGGGSHLLSVSFGPFLGFWSAFEAGCQIGAHCVPGGGMSSQLRLAMIESVKPTVVCCTPTYALRLAEVAAEAAIY